MSKFTVFQLTSLFLIATAVAPAFAQTPYDAVWDVTVETKAGSCEAWSKCRLAAPMRTDDSSQNRFGQMERSDGR
jgi:hypothetical protein